MCNNHIYSVLLFWQQTHIHSLSRAARNLDLHTHTHLQYYMWVLIMYSLLFFFSFLFFLSASVFVSSSRCLLLPYLISGFPAHNMTVFVFPPLHHLFFCFISLRYFVVVFSFSMTTRETPPSSASDEKGNEENRRLAYARSGGSV